MDLVKTHWEADASNVSLSMPIAKVDKKNRLVSGFATLDNVDTGDDVVMATASQGAFTRFRGNIREMHEPIAAGRLVDFREDSLYDPETKKFYNGVYVTAYVSVGAESTWQKVLDGTLSGFSIGGKIKKQKTEYVPDLAKSVRYVEEYDLIELSLVDNPANQLANVFSFVKNQSGELMMKGMAVDTHLVNVFWCPVDEIAKNSPNESETCLACTNSMEQIGWFEKGEDEAVKTAAAVADFLRQREVTTDDNTGEGGVNMTNTITKADDVVVTSDVTVDKVQGNVDEAGNARAEAAREAEANGTVLSEEEAAAVEEIPTTEDADADKDEDAEGDATAEVDEAPGDVDLEKMFDDLKESVTASIEKTVSAVDAKVDEIQKAWDAKAEEYNKSLATLTEGLEAVRGEREDVAKRLKVLEGSSAIRKSGEVETEPVTKVKKGLWSGTFFDADA
jgi:hypothetical protein